MFVPTGFAVTLLNSTKDLNVYKDVKRTIYHLVTFSVYYLFECL